MPDYTQDIEDVKNYLCRFVSPQYRNKPKGA